MLSYFFPEPKEQTTTDKICEHMMSAIIETINKELPNAEEGVQQVISQCKKEIQKNVHENVQNIDAKQVYDFVTANIVTYLSEYAKESDPAKVKDIQIEIQNGKELITMSKELGTKLDKYDQIDRFRKKINASKKYQNIFKSIKSVVNILALGETGVGKTALVKSLFDLKNNELKLKGGVRSDTDFVKTYKYKINEVTLLYTDSPGFFDTRGSDKAKKNMSQIISHIKKNDIDIVLWVAKICDLVNEKHFNLLEKLTKLFGVDVWKKTIIVLTHANNLPPDEYYENDDGEELEEVVAWKAYTDQKKYVWRDAFDKIQYGCEHKVSIPVVLVENSIRRSNKIDGIRTLRDGTPFLQYLIKKIFSIIKQDKAPIVFLSMAGSCEKDSIEKDGVKQKLNEQQMALNNATDEIFHKVLDPKDGGKNNSWCYIF